MGTCGLQDKKPNLHQQTKPLYRMESKTGEDSGLYVQGSIGKESLNIRKNCQQLRSCALQCVRPLPFIIGKGLRLLKNNVAIHTTYQKSGYL